VPTRPAPQVNRQITPTTRPQAIVPTAPTTPGRVTTQRPTTRPSAPTTVTRPGLIDRTPGPATTRPGTIDRTPDRVDRTRPAFVNRPEINRNRTTINRTTVNRNVDVRNRVTNQSNVTVNRWGRSGGQIGAPRTWYTNAGNWNRSWWGGRPAWYWGRPWYWQHAGWHHGYWNYWVRPPAFWFGAGLLGGWLLSPGETFVYYNPYWVAPAVVPTYLDYSVPLPIVTAEQETIALPPDPDQLTDTTVIPTAPTDTNAAEANRLLDSAREAFRIGEYTKAQVQVETAIRLLPSDPAMHEFRALTLFAQGKYQEATATLYSVLTSGPGWDWATMSGQYADVEVYATQLRALERFVAEYPDTGYGHFLLAYHYLVTEHRDSAVHELREVVRLQPDDKLAAALLSSMTSGDAASGAVVPPPPGR